VKTNLHERIEALAGAIALGEATDEERNEYREHIASCAECLNALGGEREIERVAASVHDARESEVWQPDLRDVVAARTQRSARRLRLGFGVAGLCLAVSLGVHALGAAGAARLAPSAGAPVVINAGSTRIVLEQRTASAAAVKPAPAPVPQRRMIVEHNVVQIARQPVQAAPVQPAPLKPDVKPQQIAAITVHPDRRPAAPELHSGKSNIPIWRRNSNGGDAWRTVATTTTTSLMETAPQTLTHSAESVQLASPHTMREAMPVGGETAINPKPAMIAYDEGAEGTSVFEVLIDREGNPTRCIITKSAGYTVLDSAVCKAAMQAHYTPKVVDGRAVPGVYHDAFTFRMSQDDQSIEGIPKQIQ
jgi:TonB family protein